MDNSKTLNVQISKIEMLTPEIALFELSSTQGIELPPFDAGAHIDVHTPSGMTRQYSLCGNANQLQRYQIAVLKEMNGRGGSQSMHDKVKIGDVITISTPRNHFGLARDSRHSLLLAGGIGITPLLSMAETLSQTDQDFDLHYCARSVQRIAFVDRIQASKFADKVSFHFDDGNVEQQLEIESLLATPDSGTHLYVCGPKGFMDAVLKTARTLGWDDQNLHYEFFSATPNSSQSDDAFEVVVASSGRVISVAKDQTILAALNSNGIDLPFSCEQGVCGTCLTKVLEGTPDHRDMYLTPEEQSTNDQMLVCCSRSKSVRLVLDL